MENKDKDGNVIVPTIEVDPIAEKDAQIAKLENDLQNYKNVAMKRLGKLPGDADFVESADKTTGLTVEETIRKALLDNEYAKLTKEKNQEVDKLKKTVSELTLALKNRPEHSIAGDGATAPTLETKDNVLTDGQLEELKRRAKMLGLDETKYIENAKKNLAARR